MSRFYSVVANATITSAGGDTDLMELTPADDRPIKLRRFVIGQTSELGDTAEESRRIQIIRLPATVTSGNGSIATPAALDSDDGAADFTAKINATTPATTSGTAVILDELAWNLRASPCDFWWPDEDLAPTARQGEVIVIRLPTAVTDDVDMNYTAYIQEF